MSKFKVGDKVVCGGEVKTITRVDEWGNDEYGYYFNINDDMLNYYTDDDLELYKTPHERLIELGWVALNETGRTLTYILYSDGSLHAERIELSHEGKSFYTTLRIIDLQLAKILVRYLEELNNETTKR